jgi:Tfp pilus assembly protein PilV
VINRLRSRFRSEAGFGLVEILIALTLLNVALLTMLAAFESGVVAIRRASHISTAATLADIRMELYRSLPYAAIGLDTSAALDGTYTGDPSYTAPINSTSPSCTGNAAQQCLPIQNIARTDPASPDHHNYRVDAYIGYTTPAGGRQLKQVTVVVRDGDNLAKTLARETSTFDPSSG